MLFPSVFTALLVFSRLPCALSKGELVELRCDWAPAALEVYARYDLRRAAGFILQAVQIARQVATAFDDNEK